MPNMAAASPARSQPLPYRRSKLLRAPPERTSRAGEDTVDQLFHGRDEAVGVERVGLEPERRVAGEHQVLLDGTAVRDVLERLLDAEAARIGEAPGRVLLIVGPGREGAL